jgi:Domain of unknown function (DUF4258)
MQDQHRPKRKAARPQKIVNLCEKIRKALALGHCRDTCHSLDRRDERNVDLPEIIEVLETGFHEKAKDEYKEEFKSWNYAIRGKTSEGIELRVAVYFEEDLVMIATVIKL